MEDNMIAIAASYAWQFLTDAWEVYASAPTFILSITFFTQSEPGAFALISAWLVWIFLTAVVLFTLLEFLIKSEEDKSSKRFIELKQATLSALAESANSDEANCTLPSKATAEINYARIEKLLKEILAALEPIDTGSDQLSARVRKVEQGEEK